MKQHLPQFILISIIISILGGLLSLFILEGFRHVVPGSALRQAQFDWANGKPLESIPKFVDSFGLAIQSGSRWTLARIFINSMIVNKRNGDMQEALSNCAQAVKIIHGYDDGGSLSSECLEIERSIKQHINAP